MDEYSDFFNPLQQDLNNTHSLFCIYGSDSRGFSGIYTYNKDGYCRILKALKEEYRGDTVYESLLRKEYEIGVTLNHPHICQTISFISHPLLGNCIEMEWVDGCTLDSVLKAGSLTIIEKRQLISQLCDALSYIHSKQIIHRDIKPSNILVTYNGHNLKLIDFGLSDSDSYSRHKEPAGTRRYSAPEMLDGSPVDCRSDIYSLGKVIAEISSRYPSVVRRCCKRNPAQRYSDASDVKKGIFRQKWLYLAPIFLLVAISVLLLLPLLSLDPDKADIIVRQAEEIIRQSGT